MPSSLADASHYNHATIFAFILSGAAVPAEAVQPPKFGLDPAASRVQTHH